LHAQFSQADIRRLLRLDSLIALLALADEVID
jgi:hypothetical protein